MKDSDKGKLLTKPSVAPTPGDVVRQSGETERSCGGVGKTGAAALARKGREPCPWRVARCRSKTMRRRDGRRIANACRIAGAVCTAQGLNPCDESSGGERTITPPRKERKPDNAGQQSSNERIQ